MRVLFAEGQERFVFRERCCYGSTFASSNRPFQAGPSSAILFYITKRSSRAALSVLLGLPETQLFGDVWEEIYILF